MTAPSIGDATRHGAVQQWLDARIRSLTHRPEVGRWASREQALSEESLAGARAYLRRASGVCDPRAGMRILTGWIAGPVVSVIGALAARDGIGVDLAASAGVELGLAAEGYVADLAIARPRVSVLPDHAWAGSPEVGVVADERALDELAIAGIVAWCGPVIEALEPSGRGRGPLWAQIPDALGSIAPMLSDADPQADPQRWIDRVERLMAVPGPWRRAPRLWVADAEGEPVAICHRSSCCLYYRSEEPEESVELDADFLARFGDESPQYCGTCRLREPEDVEARTVYWALRARAAQA